MRKRDLKLLRRVLPTLGGSLLALGAGLLAFTEASTSQRAFVRWTRDFARPVAWPVARLSYDLPFLFRTAPEPREIALVYLDDDSAKKLKQPLGDVWNRALHGQLLDRLTNDGARLVFYDIVFDEPAKTGPQADDDFAAALARHGHVVLGAGLDETAMTGAVLQERILPPTRVLRKAAAGWGVLAFKPVDPDYAVRQLYTGTEDVPTATWKAAELLGAPVTTRPDGRPGARYLNYYGPPNTFSSVNFAQALAPEGVPVGYFKDRIVLVGGRVTIGYLGLGKDEFKTPYALRGSGFSTGVEVHANILLNLLRGEWLTRLGPTRELLLVVAVGLLVGLLGLIRPIFATLIAVSSALVLTALAFWLVWHERVWCNWLIPVGIQIPLGLIWSVGSQYYLESRRKNELRRAFGFYLSPQMVEKISNSDFNLAPGGRTVEATIMFTDLEGFTTFSEQMSPAEVSRTLIDYFERTTRCILQSKGTIVQYIGDAVMAGWNAPVDQPNHAILAVQAACDLRCLTDIEMNGRRLRTRVGINTGNVLAGNLGSSFRFDYSMIGDTTNFASRLESMNKFFGTQVLISESTRLQLRDGFITRPLGEFRAKGKTKGVVIHELICRCNAEAGERAWIEVFAEGLRRFRSGDFSGGRELMRETQMARGGSDGPAEFYLKTLEALEIAGRLEGWSGIVDLTEK